MDVIVIDSEAFEQLKLEIKGYIKWALNELLQEKQLAHDADWITLEEARKILPYKSKSTWQNLRDKCLIEFSQTANGRHILYSRKSILKYIESNKVKF